MTVLCQLWTWESIIRHGAVISKKWTFFYDEESSLQRKTESFSAVKRKLVDDCICQSSRMPMHGCINQCNCVNVTFIVVDKWMDTAWLLKCLPEECALFGSNHNNYTLCHVTIMNRIKALSSLIIVEKETRSLGLDTCSLFLVLVAKQTQHGVSSWEHYVTQNLMWFLWFNLNPHFQHCV